MPALLRRLVFGRPIASELAHEHRLPKLLALPIFSSDALSSVAYATQEILATLLFAGAGLAAFRFAAPIAFAIVGLLIVVTISYRQTIYAYPNGGGAYIVAKDNLGPLPATVAGAALLVDYILTVSVSVAAGIDAIISAAAHDQVLFHTLDHIRVLMCVIAVALITVANLRGVKESGAIFALPTYSFIVVTIGMVAWGAWKTMHGELSPGPAPAAVATHSAVGTFLLLKAFSSGCAALTGVEAISNGVTAFRKPEARNAATTMTWMACVLATLFLGTTFLATHLRTHYQVGGETVISQVGRAVFGTGPLYYFLQAATAGILILAANTSFAGFPRLGAMMAADGYLPRQLANIGDRLVFNNGIIVLGMVASVIIALFSGHTDYLIPLYAVGVFLSFTLSQGGMVRRWYRLRTPGWQSGALINGTGAVVTGVVTLVIAYSKWAAGEKLHVGGMAVPTGAWMVVVLVPAMVYGFFLIHNHYQFLARQLTLDSYQAPPPRKNTVLVLIPALHRGTLPALDFAKRIGDNVRAVHVNTDELKTERLRRRWEEWGRGVPLVVLTSPYRSLLEPLLEYIREVDCERDDDNIVVVIPEFVPAKWWEKILHNHSGLMLKFALLGQRNVVVCNVRYFLEPFTGPVRIVRDHEPAAHELSPNGGPAQQHTPSSSGARIAK